MTPGWGWTAPVPACSFLPSLWGFPGASDGKESACHARDPGLIPGLGSSPGEGNGYPLQSSHVENYMDRGDCGGYSPRSHRESDNRVTNTHHRPCRWRVHQDSLQAPCDAGLSSHLCNSTTQMLTETLCSYTCTRVHVVTQHCKSALREEAFLCGLCKP